MKKLAFQKIGVFRTLRVLKIKRASLLKKYFSRAIINLKNYADISKQKTPADTTMQRFFVCFRKFWLVWLTIAYRSRLAISENNAV